MRNFLDRAIRDTQRAHKALGLLVPVEVYRRSGTADAETGRRPFAAPVTVDARVVDRRTRNITQADTTDDGKHIVFFYGDVNPSEGDRLRWGTDGVDHEVLQVEGLTKGAERFRATAITN